MRFWDSSAVVPLLVEQKTTKLHRALLVNDASMVVWWLTECECFSALARLEREGVLSGIKYDSAVARLNSLSKSWNVVLPTDAVKREVRRILRLHPLRCADALQLAAAILASEKNPTTLEFVTLDERLGEAASKEGFLQTSMIK